VILVAVHHTVRNKDAIVSLFRTNRFKWQLEAVTVGRHWMAWPWLGFNLVLWESS